VRHTRVSTPESGSDAQVEVVGRPAGNRLPVGIPFAVGWHRQLSQRRKSGPNLARLSWTCLLGAQHLHVRMRRRETCVKQSAARAETVTAMRVLLWSRSRRQTLEVCVGSGCLQNAVRSRDHHEMVVTPYGIYPAWTPGKNDAMRNRAFAAACLCWKRDLGECCSEGGVRSSRRQRTHGRLNATTKACAVWLCTGCFSRDWPQRIPRFRFVDQERQQRS
jgi:hypothetical protein